MNDDAIRRLATADPVLGQRVSEAVLIVLASDLVVILDHLLRCGGLWVGMGGDAGHRK